MRLLEENSAVCERGGFGPGAAPEVLRPHGLFFVVPALPDVVAA